MYKLVALLVLCALFAHATAKPQVVVSPYSYYATPYVSAYSAPVAYSYPYAYAYSYPYAYL